MPNVTDAIEKNWSPVSLTGECPRFGVWANVHGTMAALNHPDRDGTETFMLGFHPCETEMERFAADIIPRLVS